MIRKKIALVALTGCLVVTTVPLHYVFAENNQNNEVSTTAIADVQSAGKVAVSGDSSEANSKDLEQIIKLVKSKISVPTELSEFDYNYNSNSYDLNPSWDLNWRNKDGSKQISVQSDKSGNIISFNYNGDNKNRAPKYLKTELKSKADAFLKKIASNISSKVKYVDATSNGFHGGMYFYNYVRVENGIPMHDNAISIGVDFKTGVVRSYSASWLYNVSIPTKDTKITKEQAKDKINSKITMKLSYQNAYTTEADGTTKIKAFLVYTPDHNYIAVDAKTGEVYTTQHQWVSDTAKEELADQASTESKAGGLTKEEITKLEEMNKFISKENAIKLITDNKSLLLDKNLNGITAKLYKKSEYSPYGTRSTGTERYVWNITLNDTREVKTDTKDSYRAYAAGEVDAITGKILSFNASVKTYFDANSNEWKNVKVGYTMEQGRKTLEDFLKVQISDKFNQSTLTDSNNDYVMAYAADNKEIFGGYNYNYDRVNEGIAYSYNSINGAVDGVTGKIYNYNYNWNDNVTFESPKGAISPKNAFASYISNEGYHLVYEINNIHSLNNGVSDLSTTNYSVAPEVRLVYRTDINPNYISPFSGKVLNYDGTVYDKNANDFAYSDINNSLAERNILLLADLGIGFKGGVFKPSQQVTVKELNEFLDNVGFYQDKSKITSNEAASSITRLDSAKLALKVLNYENVADIKGIYSVDFKDKAAIDSNNIGYVAIAWGLDLLKPNGDNEFKPLDKLTREEAADLIMGMLITSKN